MQSLFRGGLHACLILLVSVFLAGCGGGGGGGGSVIVPPSVGSVQATVAWPARTRAINAPGSAMSVVITLHPSAGSDIVQSFNRSQATSFSTTYTISNVPVGTYGGSVNFFSNTSGTGSLVGTASLANVVVSENLPTSVGSVTVTDKVASVAVNAVPAGIPNGSATQLTFTAKDANNTTLALTAGSGSWTLVTGSASLTADGIITPSATGTVQVKVTVDGIVSPTISITVNAGGGGGGGTPTIYFATTDGSNTTIQSISPTGGTPTTITTLTNNYQGFAYTPSGSKVAFGYTSTPLATTPMYGVFEGTTFARGPASRLTGDLYTAIGSMQFANDGQTVFYTSQISGSTSTTESLNTVTPGHSIVILDSGEDMALDSTGTKIVYTKLGAALAEVWKMNVDGTGITQVTNDGAIDKGRPQWSADGNSIVFIGFDSLSNEDVYTVPATGGTATNLTHGSHGFCIGASMSPDGTKVAFDTLGNLNTMNSDGTNVSSIFTGSMLGSVFWLNGGAGPLVSRDLSGGSGPVGGQSLWLKRVMAKRKP